MGFIDGGGAWPSPSLIGGGKNGKTFFGKEEVVVHDVDRENAWVSIQSGLPLVVRVRLCDLRVEASDE